LLPITSCRPLFSSMITKMWLRRGIAGAMAAVAAGAAAVAADTAGGAPAHRTAPRNETLTAIAGSRRR